MGLCGLVFLLFLTLKLIGVITWSWFFVTMPVWLPIVLIILLYVCGASTYVSLTRRGRA